MDLFDLYENLRKLQSELETTESSEVDIEKLLSEAGLDMDELEQQIMTPDSKVVIGFSKSSDEVKTPFYNYESDSGFDLYSTENVIIEPLGRALIPTGLSFDIKDGFEIQVRSKSGLAINEGLFVLNSPGTVDNGYTGEVKVILFNTNPTPYEIKVGMKIGQAVVSPVVNGKWVQLQEINKINDKDRNSNGFGSTGI
jgi:dUTP pyrophosphatase